METSAPNGVTGRMRRTVRLAAILNLTYFGVEVAVALAIGSVSLFADSIDFLEDTAINFLILLALDWRAQYRARMGVVLAGVLLVPGVATLWTAWHKFTVPVPPSPLPLSLAGAGALAVNLSCAIMLARYRQQSGSLTRAAFLSARNDVLANLAIIARERGCGKRDLSASTGGTARNSSLRPTQMEPSRLDWRLTLSTRRAQLYY
jgi:Co/Zn/Cd efflux system component